MVNGVLTIPLSATVANPSQPVNTAALRMSEFVAGAENALAATALHPYLERSATSYNPLVLYGPHGSGKSHLALGLVDWWQKHFPEATVVSLTGAEFAQQYAAALAHDQLDAWRAEIRSAQLLVLEDLGELARKGPAQAELLHTLDALVECDTPVVITARSLPTYASSLLPALRSRLSAGLAVPLVYPARATRRWILVQLAADRGFPLPRRALDGLADHLAGGVPLLVSAILELELAARTDGEAIDSKSVRELTARRNPAGEVSIREIATLTARYFGLKVSDLKSPRRRRALVTGRCIAMYLARHLTSSSLGEIGKFFGGRDHTTVLYGCRRTEGLLRRDRSVRQAITELKRMLASA